MAFVLDEIEEQPKAKVFKRIICVRCFEINDWKPNEIVKCVACGHRFQHPGTIN